jgi:hypothetical protein
MFNKPQPDLEAFSREHKLRERTEAAEAQAKTIEKAEKEEFSPWAASLDPEYIDQHVSDILGEIQRELFNVPRRLRAGIAFVKSLRPADIAGQLERNNTLTIINDHLGVGDMLSLLRRKKAEADQRIKDLKNFHGEHKAFTVPRLRSNQSPQPEPEPFDPRVPYNRG